MTVIADTSPLNYLVLIGTIEVLPQLFGTVLIPREVLHELQDPATPPGVLAAFREPPTWLHVVEIHAPSDAADMSTLGAGERAAIGLALEDHDRALLLIDEIKGRRVAAQRGLKIMGTLGLLEAGASRGLLDLPSAIGRLQETNFHVAPTLLDALLKRHS